MTPLSVPGDMALAIAAVERDTGLSKDTLRVWERRYGFPSPGRDAFGERVYPLDQIEKLRTLKRLLDGGHRPGKIIALPIEDLRRLALAGSDPARSLVPDGQGELNRYVELLLAHRADELRRELSQQLLRKGLARFIGEDVAPMNDWIGVAWRRGDLQVFEEHLYTEIAQGLLRQAIESIRGSGQRPRVMLSTLPQEEHGLGILMAEAVFAVEGCNCVSLGVQTPVSDLAAAAEAQRADIVALSFSEAFKPNRAIEGLVDLLRSVPPGVEIWAGGACRALRSRQLAGVTALHGLDDIGPALRRWRQRHEVA